MRDSAIANFQRALSLDMGNMERRLLHAGPGGKSYTPEQVVAEMQVDPPTREGLSLIRIWCMSDEQVQREIEKARSSVAPSSQ